MTTITRPTYTLLYSLQPCDIFHYFEVDQMHGLSLKKCQSHLNNEKQAYIAGLTNYIPKTLYRQGDPMFIYLNLNRARTLLDLYSLVHHEVMHRSFELHNYNILEEESIISWAERESKEVIKLIK